MTEEFFGVLAALPRTQTPQLDEQRWRTWRRERRRKGQAEKQGGAMLRPFSVIVGKVETLELETYIRATQSARMCPKLDDRSAGVLVGEKSPSQQPWQVQDAHSTGVPTAHRELSPVTGNRLTKGQ